MIIKTLIEALQNFDENLEVLLKDEKEFTSYLWFKVGVASAGVNPFIFNFQESKDNPDALLIVTPANLLSDNGDAK
jgi:hypothetical protein